MIMNLAAIMLLCMPARLYIYIYIYLIIHYTHTGILLRMSHNHMYNAHRNNYYSTWLFIPIFSTTNTTLSFFNVTRD